ncbi:glycosyltransferase family 4 protein [Nitratireductor sp. CH_MIT9313-5]|uniref:glycosyltransferase family 4 protein n=1 Tax=Nitratireductor sp. CH_MIT9313-5 TaxID=3107764 RepID=UPI00300A43D5
MNILYAYRYGIVGGVSTQLLLRRRALADVGMGCTLFFSQDNGLGETLPNREDVYFGSDIEFRRLVRARRFDAVVVIDTPELLKPAAGPFYRRNPVYLDVHTTTRAGLSYLDGLQTEIVETIMAPTQYSAALVAERVQNRKPITVVPNILDATTFALKEPGAAPTSGAAGRHLIWVGKLDHHKNWRLALIYTAMLREMFQDVFLHVVGGYTAPASQANSFFEWLQRLGLSDRVSWLDRLDNAAIANLYRRCAESGGAMLVTSRDESFGMAAAEALLCGCPIIANDLPVFREVFPATPMVQLVDIWNPEEVADAASALAGSHIDPYPLHQHLAARYGPETFVRSFKNLLGAP